MSLDSPRQKLTVDLAAIKVGRNIGYLIWESIVHLRMQFRLQDDIKLSSIYAQNFMPPMSLLIFKNASVMIMKYADLGNLVSAANMLHNQSISPFTQVHFEFCVIYITLQALRILVALHSADIVHADMKTDNWVLRSNEEGTQINLCLIDFGKAIDLKELKELSGSTSVGIVGSSAIKHFECQEMLSDQPWTFQADYYGLCASIHNLLFSEDMQIRHLTVAEAVTNGYLSAANDIETNSDVQIPRLTFKRYWDQTLWCEFFYSLMNEKDISNPKDLGRLIDLFERKISGIDENIREV